MKKSQKYLESLVRKEKISGFNKGVNSFNLNTSVLVLSNLHETEAYKNAVQKEIRTKDHSLQVNVYRKIGYTRWFPNWRIRDDRNRILPDLKVKDEKRYLRLEGIPFQTLGEAGFSQEYISTLIGINTGYELRIQSQEYALIKDIARLFIEKTNISSPKAWPDTYGTPIIFLFGMDNAEDFLPVTLYQKKGKASKFSFMQRNLEKDIEKILEEDGYEKAPCLANSLFVQRCCNQ